MRQTDRYPMDGPNSLWQVYSTISRWKAIRNFIFIQIARYAPSLSLKRWIYRRILGMKVGEHASFALMVMVDVFFPEKIEVGDNTIIGYNSTILTHEYLIKEYRLGRVKIGSHVMIGANTTILPGVTIGDHAVIGAGSVVHRDVAPYSFVAGNPLQVIREDVRESGERGSQSGSRSGKRESDSRSTGTVTKEQDP